MVCIRRYKILRYLTVLTETVELKCAGDVSAVMQHEGNFLTVDGISFFGGNALVSKRYHEKCRYLAIVV